MAAGDTPATSNHVPRVDLSGLPYEIGLQHGTQLRSQILSQLAIYRVIFRLKCKLDWPQVLEIAEEFQPTIRRLAPDLYDEMEGIAAGVAGGTGLLDIIALNARSEIALGKFDDGCTSLAWTLDRDSLPRATLESSSHRQILAQNWDWTVAVGRNLATASITQPGKPKIWMVIEPGIVGKIGFNSASVGVCLNAIRARPISTKLLPIHLFLRIALECTSVAEAISTFERLGHPASSQHILIADATSGSRGLEVSPLGSVYLHPDSHGILTHTNHFLQNRLVEEPPWLSGSPARLSRVRELCEQLRREAREREAGGKASRVSPELLRARVFSDTSGTPQAICCNMVENGNAVSTLFNIVMQFEPGKEPSAEVLFGRPGAENLGPVLKMPW